MNKFITFVAALLIQQAYSQNINFHCESMFGRTANGDGTNTYSFHCTCTAERGNNTVQTFCQKSGPSIENNCRTFEPVRSANGEIALSISQCSLGDANPDLFVLNTGQQYTTNFPLHCQGVGIAGLECKGDTVV